MMVMQTLMTKGGFSRHNSIFTESQRKKSALSDDSRIRLLLNHGLSQNLQPLVACWPCYRMFQHDTGQEGHNGYGHCGRCCYKCLLFHNVEC